MPEMSALRIEAMLPQDWPAVRDIYLEGILTGNATFETVVPQWEKWDAGHLRHSRLVARRDSEILGWASLSPVSSRTVYAGVAEVSVYVAGRVRGQGIGRRLLSALIAESERNGIWTLQAGIFPENSASMDLHQKVGFRLVGVRERIGKLDRNWRSVNLLELRSATIGA